MQLCLWGEADMGSQVVINTCTDACTHLYRGVGLEAGLLGCTHSATQGHPCFHVTMQRG